MSKDKNNKEWIRVSTELLNEFSEKYKNEYQEFLTELSSSDIGKDLSNIQFIKETKKNILLKNIVKCFSILRTLLLSSPRFTLSNSLSKSEEKYLAECCNKLFEEDYQQFLNKITILNNLHHQDIKTINRTLFQENPLFFKVLDKNNPLYLLFFKFNKEKFKLFITIYPYIANLKNTTLTIENAFKYLESTFRQFNDDKDINNLGILKDLLIDLSQNNYFNDYNISTISEFYPSIKKTDFFESVNQNKKICTRFSFLISALKGYFKQESLDIFYSNLKDIINISEEKFIFITHYANNILNYVEYKDSTIVKEILEESKKFQDINDSHMKSIVIYNEKKKKYRCNDFIEIISCYQFKYNIRYFTINETFNMLNEIKDSFLLKNDKFDIFKNFLIRVIKESHINDFSDFGKIYHILFVAGLFSLQNNDIDNIINILCRSNHLVPKKLSQYIDYIMFISQETKNVKEDSSSHYTRLLQDTKYIKQFVINTLINYIYDGIKIRCEITGDRKKLYDILFSGNDDEEIFNGKINNIFVLIDIIKNYVKTKSISSVKLDKINRIPKLFYFLRKVVNCDAKIFSPKNQQFCDATKNYSEQKNEESKNIEQDSNLLNTSIVTSGDRTLQILQLILLHILNVKDEYKEFTYIWGITDFKYNNDEKGLFWNVI